MSLQNYQPFHSALKLFSITIGSALQVPRVNAGGTAIEWATVAGVGGSVATDVIWDAAGDLVVGTGSDTAARLAKGTALQTLRVNAGATALEWATNSISTIVGVSSTKAEFDTACSDGNFAYQSDLANYVATSSLGAGVGTFLATPTSANLRSAVTDETGTGALVFATSPTLIAPVLGKGTFTSLQTNDVEEAPSGTTTTYLLTDGNQFFLDLLGASGTSHTLTLDITASNACEGVIIVKQHASVAKEVTIDGADVIWLGQKPLFINAALGSYKALVYKYVPSDGSIFIGTLTGDPTTIVGVTGTKSQFDTAVTDGNFLYVGDVTTNATHTGDATGATALTLATVNSNVGSFGSATAAVAITVNAKGLVTAASSATITPAVGSITGLGTGVGTFLATPSSANLLAAVTDETGTGSLVFATSPTLVTPVLGSGTYTALKTTEVTNTVSANAATITLGNGNHQTLTLAAATGAVTADFVMPSSSSAGTLVLLQDDTARDVTWTAVGGGTILWAGTQPTWSGDTASSYRVISWRYDGTRLFLAPTDEFTANS